LNLKNAPLEGEKPGKPLTTLVVAAFWLWDNNLTVGEVIVS
jgi:hypothetical protein